MNELCQQFMLKYEVFNLIDTHGSDQTAAMCRTNTRIYEEIPIVVFFIYAHPNINW